MLPPGTSLSAADRAWLRAEAMRLRASIAPRDDERPAMAAELLGLFAAFPAQAISERSAEARGRHYLAAVAGFPLGALAAAIGLWMRGEETGPHDNLGNCSPPVFGERP